MRSYSETFAALLGAQTKRPRFALQISFSDAAADDVWIKSHADVDLTAETGTVLAARTQEISVLSQQIFPDDGRATIGSFSFEALDTSQSLTTAQRDGLLNDAHGLRYRIVRLWVGFVELDFSEYQLQTTQIVAEVRFAEGVYKFTCNDIQREARKKIFEPVKLALAQAIDAIVTTIPINGDTSLVEALEHDAAFSDAPSVEVAYIQIDDEIIRVPVAGIVANEFTGCTRGVLATRAAEHDTETGVTADEQTPVEEVIYLEMNAVKLALAVLTGTLLNQTATMPSTWHAGIDATFIDDASFTDIGDDLYDGTDEGGVVLRFLGLDKEDAKAWVEKQICRVIGCYMPVQSDGQLALHRLERVMHGAAPVAELTDSDLLDSAALTYSMKQIYNRLEVAWNAFDGKATRFTQIDDAASIARWKASDIRTIEAHGLHGSRHSADVVRYLFERYRDRYTGPPLLITAQIRVANAALEVGDIVRLRTSSARDFTDPRAAGTLDRSFEVQSTQLDWLDGKLRVSLFGSTQAADPLGGAETSQGIPDAWFDDLGTDISGLTGVTCSGGVDHMTSNLTFAGGTSNRVTGSIWYILGDLQIDAGVTLSISGNVQLRVLGVLTVNGDIDGIAAGLTGVADTLDASSWPYISFASTPRKPYDGVSVQLGQVGYYGSPRAGGGLREAMRIEAVGQESFVDLQSFAAPATSNGVDIVPTYQIGFDGTDVTGIPASLMGCSGGPGGKRHYSQTQGSNYQQINDGGTGGDSGAGLLIVCRGMAFGASGFVDLSGGDGSVGGYDAGDDYPAHAGAGAGGAPGALIVVVDGTLNPLPVLSSASFIANYGETPDPADPPGFADMQTTWISEKIAVPGGGRPANARSYYTSPTSSLKAGVAAARALFLSLPQSNGPDIDPLPNLTPLANLVPAGLADFERVVEQAVIAAGVGGTGTAEISTDQAWLGSKSLKVTPPTGTTKGILVDFANANALYNIPLLPTRRFLVIVSIYPTNADSIAANMTWALRGAGGFSGSSDSLDMSGLTLNVWNRLAFEIQTTAFKAGYLELDWTSTGTTTGPPIFYVDGLELIDVEHYLDWTPTHFPEEFIPAGGSAVGGLAFDGGALMVGAYATPEALITAQEGSVVLANVSGVGTLYVKETGTGNTGWAALISQATLDAALAALFASGSGYFDLVDLALRIQYGRTTSSTAAGNNAVSFPASFKTATTPVVVASIRMTAVGSGVFWGVNSETTTGFNFFANAAGFPGWTWVAIGEIP